MAKTRPLTPKELRYCEEYQVDQNQTQAAIRAGYAPRSAATAACEIMKRPHIQAYIQANSDDLAVRLGLTKERILQELRFMAFTNADAYIKDGQLIPVEKMSKAALACLSEIEIEERTNMITGETIGKLKKIKRWDKQKAIDTINRMLGHVQDSRIEIMNSTKNKETKTVVNFTKAQ